MLNALLGLKMGLFAPAQEWITPDIVSILE